MKMQRLEDLPNLGKTIIQNLHSIGVYSVGDLKKVGPVGVYKKITTKYPKKTWPVCYYLYSIEGALTGKHWKWSIQKKEEWVIGGWFEI